MWVCVSGATVGARCGRRRGVATVCNYGGGRHGVGGGWRWGGEAKDRRVSNENSFPNEKYPSRYNEGVVDVMIPLSGLEVSVRQPEHNLLRVLYGSHGAPHFPEFDMRYYGR